MNLEDATVVITGASSGLGRHFAQFCADHGADVIAVARRRELLDSLREQDSRIRTLAADVTAPAAADQLGQLLAASTRPRLVLVNNAGHATPRNALRISGPDFERDLALNVTAVFTLSQLIAQHITQAQKSGSIVNIASALAVVGSTSLAHVAYCTAKAAVVGMTRQLACEWAHHQITVNALAPGWFHSDLTSDFLNSAAGAEHIRRTVPMGRAGTATELDGPLLLLASAAGSYLTGHTLVVDGGWTAQ